jgi:hypothetical protein
VRAAWFASNVVALEPSLAFATTAAGGHSTTTFNLAAAAQYHFTTNPDAVRWYVAPVTGLDLASLPQTEGTAGEPVVVTNEDNGGDDEPAPPTQCRSTKPGHQWPCILYNASPGPAATAADAAGQVTDTQFLLGLLLGAKIPLADRLALRVEGGYSHGFATAERLAADNLQLAVGGSFFIQ